MGEVVPIPQLADVEEEDSANAIIGQLKLIKDSPQALFLLDRELGQRVFTPPAANGE